MKALRIALAMILALGLSGAPALATVVDSNQASTALSMTVGESLSVSGVPSSITFTYNANGTATASSAISVTTSWALATGHTALKTYVYFANPAAALSGPSAIPSSSVLASIDGGTAQACTFTGPIGAAGGNCFPAYQNFSPASNGSQTNQVVLSLQSISNIAPGTYTGTLFIEAEAN